MTLSEIERKNKFYQIFTSIQGWTIWLLSAGFMFYKFALEVSPSVMASTLMSTFQVNAAQLGNLAACYFYAYLFLQIPAGLLLDKFGPRKATSIAITLCALGSIVFAKADSLLVAGIGRFITGIGAAFAAISCLKLIGNWFPLKRFAFMTGLMMTVAMLGAVMGQAPLSAFIETFSWRQALKIIGFAGLAISILFWLIVRNQPKDHIEKQSISFERTSIWNSLKKIFQNPQSWWLSIYSGLAFAPVMVFGGLWGVSFLQEAFGLSANQAAQASSLIYIGFAVGAPFFGWLSARVDRKKIFMFWGTLAALLSISVVIYFPGISFSLLAFLLFLFGFAISSFLLCFTIIREITSPILAATATGFMNAFDALLGAISEPFTGKLLDLNWTGKLLEGARIFSVQAYKNAFLTLPIYLSISLFVLLQIKDTRYETVPA